MKILQVMPEFALAGAEIMCENLIYELKKAGHEVIAVSMYDYHSPITERLEEHGIDIRYLGKKPGLDLSMIGKMRSLFKKERPDIIHTHRYLMQYAVPAAVLAGAKGRVHTVHNIAGKEFSKTARRLNNIFYKMCGVTPVALSELIADSIVEEYGISKDKIPVIFNGIDLTKCQVKEDNYNIEDNFKILHIGRFSEQKNHMGLLVAFADFHSRYPESELWLVGDGELRARAEEYVRENGLESSVKFLGLCDTVYSLLNEADMFILPSNFEGVPLTLIEAMGTGLPIVATPVGGVPDMLTDGESAILCDNDVSAISGAIETFYLSAEKRAQCGQAAKESSVRFSSAYTAESYIEVYKEKIGQKV